MSSTTMSNTEAAEQRRSRGEALLRDRFTWTHIAARTAQVYEAAIGGQ
jgi:hypothetical protein